jgi:RNA polymerase sigma factor (sigma-70 family)
MVPTSQNTAPAGTFNDETLLPFLSAQDSSDSARLLEILISENLPIIRNVIWRRLGSDFGETTGASLDVEDVCSTVVLRLTERLQSLKENPSCATINHFRGYVRAVTTNCCHECIREKHPAWGQLKNRLRYLFRHNPRFGLWLGHEQEVRCGLASWKGRALGGRPLDASDFRQSRHAGAIAESSHAEDLTNLVERIFHWLEGPVEFDRLVGFIGEICGLGDPTRAPRSTTTEENSCEVLPDHRIDVSEHMEQREYLKTLWNEVRQLPLDQRAALLLNLRDQDGQDVLYLLPMVAVAGLRQIAEAVGMPVGELAELWNRLPLDDEQISERLGKTRQQVINLRKAARARLARRMGEMWER